MERRSFVSSALGRAVAGNAMGVLSGVLLSVAALAQSQTPVAGADAFLELPVYELEFAAEAPSPIQVGDALKFRLGGVDPRNAGLVFRVPEGASPLLDHGWEITPIPDSAGFLAVPLKPGRLQIPALVVLNSEQRSIARTRSFSVEVVSAIAEDDPQPRQPVDPRPPVRLPFPWWFIAALGVAFVILLGIAIYLAMRWSRTRRLATDMAKPIDPPKPEDQVALAALAELGSGELLRKGEYKRHYFRVSEIIKKYLGERYRFDAPESTSREIILFLDREKACIDSILDRLESLFERLDRVKFTDCVPTEEEGLQAVEDAKKLVLDTWRLNAV